MGQNIRLQPSRRTYCLAALKPLGRHAQGKRWHPAFGILWICTVGHDPWKVYNLCHTSAVFFLFDLNLKIHKRPTIQQYLIVF